MSFSFWLRFIILDFLGNMGESVGHVFPADISWPPHHAIGEACSPLKPPGTDSLPLSGMLPNRPTISIHYIPGYLQASLYCAELMSMVFN